MLFHPDKMSISCVPRRGSPRRGQACKKLGMEQPAPQSVTADGIDGSEALKCQGCIPIEWRPHSLPLSCWEDSVTGKQSRSSGRVVPTRTWEIPMSMLPPLRWVCCPHAHMGDPSDDTKYLGELLLSLRVHGRSFPSLDLCNHSTGYR